jgi:hypothetical protein
MTTWTHYLHKENYVFAESWKGLGDLSEDGCLERDLNE